MQISCEIYEWLVNVNLLAPEGHKTVDGKVEIPKSVALLFENGIMFAKIIRFASKIIAKSQRRPESPLPNLDTLKELQSPSAKLYNWNIIQIVLKKFNINIDPDVKSLIVSGDYEMIVDLLQELYATVYAWAPQEIFDQGAADKSKNDKKGQAKKNEFKESIDLMKLDPQKDPQKSKSCLEFLILILSKHLELDPKQAASLFTHGNKYLAHVFAKGVKGLFDPVVAFFTEVYSNVPTLIKLFLEDTTRKNLHFTLNALKPGLVSKSFDVAEWSARLFSKLAFEFADSNLLMNAWEWFIGEGQGLSTTLLGLKRHPDLKNLVVSILLQFARYNFVELFTINFKKAVPDLKDLLIFQTQLLSPLLEAKSAKDEILSTGILDDWIDSSFQIAADEQKYSVDLKFAAMGFLTDVWLQIPPKIEDKDYKANNLISIMAKSTREKQQTLIFSTLTLLFKLLVQFGKDKNPFAPIIYKTLTLSLIENHMNSPVREFMLNNFIQAFEMIDNIPLNIILEPLIRQIQVTDSSQFQFHIFDFNFYQYVAKQDRLQLKNAIQLLDLLAKLYLNNIIYAPLAGIPLLTIVAKFLENDTLHEFVIKFIKISLAMYYASEKKKKPKEKILPLYNNKSPAAIQQSGMSAQEIDAEILNAQKRSLIVQIIKNIVGLNHTGLNEKVKPLVAHTNIQIKTFAKSNNKGMMSILELFGNGEEVLKLYEDEFKEHQSQLKLEEKESLEKQQQQLAETNPKYDFENLVDSKDETIILIEKNLAKYDIGRKRAKITKKEMSILANLRNPKADVKVVKELEQIKKNYKDKIELDKMLKQQEDTILENKKVTLRKGLMKRSIEQGVSNLNRKDQDAQNQLLFDFGVRENQLKRERKAGLLEMVYIDLTLEENRDQEMVANLFRNYQKAFKFLFNKYAGTGFNQVIVHSAIKSFDEKQQQTNLISTAELMKMLKDYKFESLISQDEHKSLVRLINIDGLQRKDENQSLDYNGFLQFFVQLSVYAHSKPSAVPPIKIKVEDMNNQQQYLVNYLYPQEDKLSKLQTQNLKKEYFQKGLNEKWQTNLRYQSNKVFADNTVVNQSLLNASKLNESAVSKKPIFDTSALLSKSKSVATLQVVAPQIIDKEVVYQQKLRSIIEENSQATVKFGDLIDLRHLPISMSVIRTLMHIRDQLAQQKQSTLLFDEPDSLFFGEQESIKFYNQKLKEDPEYSLPQGYSKKKEKDIQFEYQLIDKFEIPSSFRDCYEIVTGVFDSLGIKILEPIATITEVTKAYPLISCPKESKSVVKQLLDKNNERNIYNYPQNPPKSKLQPVSETPDFKQFNQKNEFRKYMKNRAMQSAENLFKILPGSTFDGYLKKYSSKKVLPIDNFHKLSLGMKLAISGFTYEKRWTAEQCAYVLDDMIKCMEQDRENIVVEGLYHPPNALSKQKEQVVDEQKKVKEQRSDKMKNMREYNLQMVKEDIEKIKPVKEEKQKKEEDKKQKEEEQQSKKQQFREKWLTEQKQKVVLKKEEDKQKTEQQFVEENKMKEEQEKVRKESFDKFSQEYIEKQNNKLKEKLEIHSAKKVKEEQSKKLQVLYKDINKIRPQKERLYKKIFDMDKKRKQYEQEQNAKIKALHVSHDFAEIYKKNKKKLQTIFDILQGLTFKNVSKPTHKDEIDLKTFTWFCYHFKAIPQLMNTLDTVLIYRTLTRDRKQYDHVPVGLTYDTFLEALTRVAIKGKVILNWFAKNISENKMQQGDLEQMDFIQDNSLAQGIENSKIENQESQQQQAQNSSQVAQPQVDETLKKTNLHMYIKQPLSKIQIKELLESGEYKLTREQQDKLNERLRKLEKEEYKQQELQRAKYEKQLLIKLGKFPVSQHQKGQQNEKGAQTLQAQSNQVDQSKPNEKQENNPENLSQMLDEDMSEYQKLCDNYGKIEDCSGRTLEVLLFYMGFPEDKRGIEELFKIANYRSSQPDNFLRSDLLAAMKEDPRNFIFNNQTKSMNNTSKLNATSNNVNKSQNVQPINEVQENQENQDNQENQQHPNNIENQENKINQDNQISQNKVEPQNQN